MAPTRLLRNEVVFLLIRRTIPNRGCMYVYPHLCTNAELSIAGLKKIDHFYIWQLNWHDLVWGKAMTVCILFGKCFLILYIFFR